MQPFSTLWKQQKTVMFSVFKGSRKGALGTNGLKSFYRKTLFFCNKKASYFWKRGLGMIGWPRNWLIEVRPDDVIDDCGESGSWWTLKEVFAFCFPLLSRAWLSSVICWREALSLLLFYMKKKTRNATRCNNCNDLLHLSFLFENFNIFGGLYIIQLDIYDRAFLRKIVSR